MTGEYYLPELIRLAVEGAIAVEGLGRSTRVRRVRTSLLGVNDRVELAHADSVLRQTNPPATHAQWRHPGHARKRS